MSTSNETSGGSTSIDHAIAAFLDGDPILVHDAADREGETDIVYPAGEVDSDAVARMRNDAGGLICVALSNEVAEAFDLPFSQEIIDHPTAADHELGYDERSSFSLTVNHRDTYTGITDEDRALTITELATAAADPERFDFAGQFRSPGHVHLLRGAPELVDDRKGHTELGLALADVADLPPAVVVCEMLDDETGRALSPADARAYAAEHDLVYVEGREIVEQLG
ncbi:3,4-dihydroxy-2-butanone 4-phosphate synthase [Halapricum desulfuricans]|uniref:3,4-dihydroxy-2-butanone 4-phosphate synthase n=1 Tax=Halapricum desulfuricans TaxID=2841257 RepID=A0A897NH17_9EURY|nr:3,4-dihydroxy-2-butanone-4-phosphate synthase [Halapricum desulfuricans]QSG12007.1 3,4-dihydroxy-2-butanone 4-phosphate synthase [Halapricum desulfuricans]